jgi:hypothetical protein
MADDDGVTHGGDAQTLFRQKPCGTGLLDAQKSEQQMLRPDVVMQEAFGFLRRRIQRLPGLGGKRYFNGADDRAARRRNLLDLTPQLWQRHGRFGEDARGQFLSFADHPEQQVVVLDGRRPEVARFIPGKKQGPPGVFVIAFEHLRPHAKEVRY